MSSTFLAQGIQGIFLNSYFQIITYIFKSDKWFLGKDFPTALTLLHTFLAFLSAMGLKNFQSASYIDCFCEVRSLQRMLDN